MMDGCDQALMWRTPRPSVGAATKTLSVKASTGRTFLKVTKMRDSSTPLKMRRDHRTGKIHELRHSKFWRHGDAQILESMVYDLHKASRRLGRSPQAVRDKAKELGLLPRVPRASDWSEAELEILALPLTSNELINQGKLNRSREAIVAKRWRLKRCQGTARRAATQDQGSSTPGIPGIPCAEGENVGQSTASFDGQPMKSQRTILSLPKKSQ